MGSTHLTQARVKRYRDKPEVKARNAQYQRERRASNPDLIREYNRRSERKRKLKKYGLTETTYTELLESQQHLCAICEEPNSSSRDWHVDHCHTTGHVRGILCHNCNLMLGHARDNTATLHKAIAYLERDL